MYREARREKERERENDKENRDNIVVETFPTM